jgi:hypothetical protein
VANQKNAQSLLSHIGQLVDEEERPYAKIGLADHDHARLADVKVELGISWDLLRQHRGVKR